MTTFGRRAMAGFWLTAAAVAAWQLWPSPQGGPMVFRGASVFDGLAIRGRADVVVADGHIACIGQCAPPPGARLIDARDHFITPGLVDLHVHLAAHAGEHRASSLSSGVDRPEPRRALLASGVTTVRSVGDDVAAAARVHDDPNGPAVHFAGPAFTAPGGHPVPAMKGRPWIEPAGVREVHDPSTIPEEVSRLADQGAGGVKAVYDDLRGRAPKLDRDVLRTLGAQARSHGLWFAVHVGTEQDLLDALEAGATTIEHIPHDISDDALHALAVADATLVPTLTVARAHAGPQVYEKLAANVARAHRAGVSLGVGSDTQGRSMAFGRSTVDELRALVAAGVDRESALRAATSTATSSLGETSGVLQPGAPADLVVWTNDPTYADARTAWVVRDGRIHPGTAEPR